MAQGQVGQQGEGTHHKGQRGEGSGGNRLASAIGKQQAAVNQRPDTHQVKQSNHQRIEARPVASGELNKQGGRIGRRRGRQKKRVDGKGKPDQGEANPHDHGLACSVWRQRSPLARRSAHRVLAGHGETAG